MTLHGYFFEDLAVGQTAIFGKTITEADIVLFAGISGDTNPVHLNEEYASQTMFKGRIAHGMLSAGLISTVFGTKLPGPGCIYISQNLKFKAPVKIGDTAIAKVELIELLPEKKRASFKTTVSVGSTIVIDGDATLMVPSRG
ncbi:MaoC family dehydratase [Telmatospirillum siberiense]|uniref:(R)-hydratase n=1 Tax=Telmatospirillum siberiense TaxID=382514 RepID=A0A2N3PNS6_9PROT|nr:MaoC family dehydratase [Telmatospirillum siberiense]PKU22037.1 (R)-hydratase [Telmatospirillum siberiense]